MCIEIACFPGCDIINYKMTIIFLMKPFFHMIKMSRQKFKYLQKENREIKSIFIIFERISVAKNGLRPESAPLKDKGG